MARRVTPQAASWLSRSAVIAAGVAVLASLAAGSGDAVALKLLGAGAIAVVVSRWMPRLHIFASGAVVYLLLITPISLAPVAVALLVMAAGLQLVADRGRAVTLTQLKSTWIASAAAAVITIVLAGLTVGPFTGSPSAAGAPPQRQSGATGGGDNPVSRLLGRAIVAAMQLTGVFIGGAQADSASPATDPDPGVDWMRVVLLVAAVVLIALALWWVWRRWRRRPSEQLGHGMDWAVRSLDQTGSRVARSRRLAEDPASYGGEIESSSSDGRLASAGALVSDHLYRPRGSSQTGPGELELRTVLDGLSDLPSVPRLPRRRPSRKQVGVAAVLILVATFGAYALWRGPHWIGEEPTTESMLTAPADQGEGYRWVLCGLELDDETTQYSGEVRGFVDRSTSLAVIESFGPNGARIFVDDAGPQRSYNEVGGVESDWVAWPDESGLTIGTGHLRTIDGVIEAFGIESEGVRFTEPGGGVHVSWERPNHLSNQSGLMAFGVGAGDFSRRLSSSAYRLEAWIGGDGVVESVRVTLQEFERTSIELRFVESVPVVERPGVGVRTSLNLFGDCPESQEDATASGWRGFEPYEATVGTVADVAVDDHGRAYDVDWWIGNESEPTEINSTEVGSISFDRGTAHFFDAYEMLYGGAVGVDVVIASDDAVEMTISRLDFETDGFGFGGGLRFDRDDQQVDRWEAVSGECSFFNSVAISSSPDGVWPGLSEEALYDDWFGPVVTRIGDESWIGYSTVGETCLDVYVGWADDRVQSVLLRDISVPWRLVVTEGSPPAEVQAAERRLQECLDGERRIGIGGSCGAG